MAMGQHGISIFAILLLLIGFALLLTGEVTDHWVHQEVITSINAGLWRVCAKGICLDSGDFGGFTTSTLDSVRAMTIIGLILGGLSVGVVLISVMVTNNTGSTLGAMVLAFLSAICTIVGIVVYATKYNKDNNPVTWILDWSFYLAMSGGIVTILAGVVLLFERRKRARAGYESM